MIVIHSWNTEVNMKNQKKQIVATYQTGPNTYVEVTKEEQEYHAFLRAKILPETGHPYPWDEFERRHRILDYLWNRKFSRG
tara:strand:+ start:92 stop:334 length:243 start_codon:yes stop_codon:yes gene_type:complete